MKNNQTQVFAARHICEEATKVLSTLRRGPPTVSRGSLVHNLRELRRQVKSHFLDPQQQLNINNVNEQPDLSCIDVGLDVAHNDDHDDDGRCLDDGGDEGHSHSHPNSCNVDDEDGKDGFEATDDMNIDNDLDENESSEEVVIVENTKHIELVQDIDPTEKDTITFTDSERYDETPIMNQSDSYPQLQNHQQLQYLQHQHPTIMEIVEVGMYAQPFLDIILDPRAAGPQTLVALRSLHRLVSRQSLTLISSSTSYFHQLRTNNNNHTNEINNNIKENHTNITSFRFEAEMEPLMRGILECRFEQTDAGADEAVEMAIADLLSLIVSLDKNRVMDSEVIMEAFNTVFVTRNTFVHSPALCYHFEQVLDGMIRDLFANLSVRSPDGNGHCAIAAKMIMEFLVSQLLHTPMTLDDGGNTIMSKGSMEAFTMHNDTRILCLRLIQTCLKIGWGNISSYEDDNTVTQQVVMVDGILKIIKDELCLSLLLVGQGIWAYQDPTSGALPGMISMSVLSEICSTISTLWSITSLRNVLTTQFENIFTGFYQRALSLLRRLPVPHDSATFHANQIFDAEVEIILETLVDILSFHSDDNNSGTFETLFITFDCNMNRPDVAAGLLDELSRCCSGNIDDDDNLVKTDARVQSGTSTPVRQSSANSLDPGFEPQLRDVPAHLKELCADAIFGVMKTLFHSSNDIHPTTDIPAEKSLRRLKEQKMVMRKAVELFNQKSSKGFTFMVENGLFGEAVTPHAVASFLRTGLVLGLDKRAVGAYLGEKGKSPVAGKSPPSWERDWFHKEALLAYCSSFHFKNQSLLDGLRMFLAAFRLPGEAQQIDRILQSFAESCGLQCEESQNGSLQFFSTDPKKASDAAYLLSFSIIMLNTDLHNDNIRPDRKMKIDDFVKNNTDYGRDITDPDKKLPREYLEGIYVRIKDEHIRTEGEGADGIMTFERWKDVMRNLGEDIDVDDYQSQMNIISGLVLEAVKDPIFSAICGFWGMSLKGKSLTRNHQQSGMLGVQGSRFGMDLTYEMIKGLKTFAPGHLFQDFFIGICHLTGLLGDYQLDPVYRTSNFVESVERQSCCVVVMKVASEFGDFLGTQGWMCVMGILFELRDLKLLGGGTQIKHRSLIIETDPDLLRSDTRRDWEMRLVKQCYEATGVNSRENRKGPRRSGLLGSMGRALFGSETDEKQSTREDVNNDERKSGALEKLVPSKHGKEELVLWDDLAPSDDEDELDFGEQDTGYNQMRDISLGHEFELQLIIEDNSKSQPGPPITGLETIEDTRVTQKSPRAKVRRRLSRLCDFSMILSETRFLDIEGVKSLVQALIQLIDSNSNKESSHTKMSPGSEALAEVMITEIALKNRDRIASLWSSCLKSHYQRRLTKWNNSGLSKQSFSVTVIPGIEKCLTGLLRICYHTVHREGVNNEVLKELKLLSPYCLSLSSPNPTLSFDKHIAEGLWRICRDVDGLLLVGNDGWEGILDLMSHSAGGGEILLNEDGAKFNSLSDDDPALQAFRCIHLVLHSNELKNIVPFDIVHTVRALISGGERQNCPKLSLAGLDLLLVLLTRLYLKKDSDNFTGTKISNTYWVSILEGIAESSDSKFTNTRQHSIAMLRDASIDRYSKDVPITELCRVLNGICLPTINQRIVELVQHQTMLKFDQEEIMIELELCISTIFKPFLHHLETLLSNPDELTAVWLSLLSVISHLLGKETQSEKDQIINPNNHLLKAPKDLATEHLRNILMILVSKGVLRCDDDITTSNGKDISSMTWNVLNNMHYCKHLIAEWRQGAKSE